MTHAELKQLRYLPGMLRLLKKEFRQLQGELEKHIVTDSVTGSDEESPYITHAISIRGVEDTEEACILEGRIQRKQEEIVDCEGRIQRMQDFISSIKDLEVQKMVRLYYEKGKGWQEIAFLFKWRSEGSPRKKVANYFRNSENSDFGEL